MYDSTTSDSVYGVCVCIVPLIMIILHCIAYFDLPECGTLPSSFSQGPMMADESINASVASYHRLGVPGVDMTLIILH